MGIFLTRVCTIFLWFLKGEGHKSTAELRVVPLHSVEGLIGHRISTHSIEIDCVKIEVIEKLPPPALTKAVCSFLGHAWSCGRFIKDLSKITKPLCTLLKETIQV